MDDLTITRLCAEAMGCKQSWVEDSELKVIFDGGFADYSELYNPLHDDAQAMALVKKFGLTISKDPDAYWHAMDIDCEIQVPNKDINRAICECIARMQEVKNEADKRFGQPHYGHGQEAKA